MALTSLSLLQRLGERPNESDWRRLVDIYSPYIRKWLRHPAIQCDSDDLLQDILSTLVRELPDFRRQRTGSFRAWLRTITVNRVRLYWRQRGKLTPAAGGTDHVEQIHALADPNGELSRHWDREHDTFVVRRLMEVAVADFEPDVWMAFQLQAVEGLSASAAAAKLGKTVNAVLLAKSRVLRRLRDEAAGLIESEKA